MRTRTTTALGTVGIAAIGAALFAVPAQAAQTNQADAPAIIETAKGDRLQGKLILDVYANTSAGSYYSIGTGDATQVPAPWTPRLDVAEANAAVYSIPAVDTIGSVVDENGKCLAATPALAVIAETCNGSVNQQWTLDASTFHLKHSSAGWERHLGGKGATADSKANISGNAIRVHMDYMSPAPDVKDVAAVVVSVDHEEKSALISGTGEPGATIVVATPTGDVTTKVKEDGTWSLTAPGLAVGDNTLPVKQVIDGKTQSETSVNVIIEALEVPVAHPAVAAAVVGAGALALIPVIRRRIA